MDIKQINNKYFHSSEMNEAKQKGINSSMYSYRNGIMYIKVFLNSQWSKNYQVTAYEVAHNWRNNVPELKKALGAKVFIIDLHKQMNEGFNSEDGSQSVSHAKKGILFMVNQLN